MTKNKKLLIGIGIVAMLSIAFVGIYKTRQQTTDDDTDVRIGVILPLTGAVGADGRMALASLQLAEEDVCARNPEIRCRFFYEDGKYDAKATISCFNKLMLDRPDALMVLGDVPNNSLNKLMSDSKMPDLALVTCDETLIEHNEWMFAGWFPFSVENDVLCKYAAEKLKVRKLGILYLRNNFGDEALRTFKLATDRYNCEVLIAESFDMDSPDVKSQVAKVLSHKPDAVYVAGFGQGYIAVFNELYSAGYSGALLSNTAISIDGNRLNIIHHAKGVYYVDVAFNRNAGDSKLFVEKFKKKTGKFPSSTFATIYAMGRYLANVAINARRDGVRVRDLLMTSKEDNSIIGGFKHNANGRLEAVLNVQRVEGCNE